MALPIPGRTYDVTVFNTRASGVPGLDVISLLDISGPQGTSVTGILKLSQRVLLELLTELGSMPYAPTRGCAFLTAVRGGLVQSDADLFQQFAFAANLIKRNLALDALATDPPDEVLAEFALSNAVFAPGQIAISVTITSSAGTSAAAILPIGTDP